MMSLNKRREKETYDMMKVKLSEAMSGVQRVGRRMTKDIRKSICLFSALIETIPMGKIDESLKNLGDYFNNCQSVIYKDHDYLILVFKLLARYAIMTSKTAKMHFEEFNRELKEMRELQSFEDLDKDASHVIAKKVLTLYSCFDAFIEYKLLVDEDEEKNMSPAEVEALETCRDTLLTIVQLMFEGNEYINLIATRGFAKLLLHKDIDPQTDYITFLLLLWQDQNIRESGFNSLVEQISNFFYLYSSQHIEKLENLGNAA